MLLQQLLSTTTTATSAVISSTATAAITAATVNYTTTIAAAAVAATTTTITTITHTAITAATANNYCCLLLRQLISTIRLSQRNCNGGRRIAKFQDANSYYLWRLIVTPETVTKTINAMKDNKSPGVDAVPPINFMETVEQINIQLARVFNCH